jgi:iron complex transport system permease protein
VLFNIRLPRVLAAALVGAALAAAGAAYQTIFRNPLVSPDVLSVSAGAGFGAVLGILLSAPVIVIQLMGFAGGLRRWPWSWVSPRSCADRPRCWSWC